MDDGDLLRRSLHLGSTGTPRGVGHRLRDFSDNAVRYATANELDESHRFHHSLADDLHGGLLQPDPAPVAASGRAWSSIAPSTPSRCCATGTCLNGHRVDVLWLVPTIMAMLLKVDRGDSGRTFCREHVRHVTSGTAPLDPDLREEFEREYGVAIHDSYGLSETLSADQFHRGAARPACRRRRRIAWGRTARRGDAWCPGRDPGPISRHDARLPGGVG